MYTVYVVSKCQKPDCRLRQQKRLVVTDTKVYNEIVTCVGHCLSSVLDKSTLDEARALAVEVVTMSHVIDVTIVRDRWSDTNNKNVAYFTCENGKAVEHKLDAEGFLPPLPL